MTEVANDKKTAKKQRVGRWTKTECSVFEELLDRFGKNWRKIQDHMKGRSLSQIRSHGQKFLEKVGPKIAQEYERKTKLLLAYETLEKEKLLQGESQHKHLTKDLKFIESLVKDKEECSSFSHNQDQTLMTQFEHLKNVKQAKIIKEQIEENPIIKEEVVNNPSIKPIEANKTVPPKNMGYLMFLIQCYPDYFAKIGLTQNTHTDTQSNRASSKNSSNQ